MSLSEALWWVGARLWPIPMGCPSGLIVQQISASSFRCYGPAEVNCRIKKQGVARGGTHSLQEGTDVSKSNSGESGVGHLLIGSEIKTGLPAINYHIVMSGWQAFYTKRHNYAKRFNYLCTNYKCL